ncbi:hypothetical protein [Bradyrhizobium sp.]|jgi:hypothetical protein|uniref:hypothetical protein n=1 Tax=Bradyrhizobium sp. TaxID=376 RepID=UPI003C2A9826
MNFARESLFLARLQEKVRTVSGIEASTASSGTSFVNPQQARPDAPGDAARRCSPRDPNHDHAVERETLHFDQFRAGIENMIDKPERTLNNLLGYLRQNGGRLSKRARADEFCGADSR